MSCACQSDVVWIRLFAGPIAGGTAEATIQLTALGQAGAGRVCDALATGKRVFMTGIMLDPTTAWTAAAPNGGIVILGDLGRGYSWMPVGQTAITPLHIQLSSTSMTVQVQTGTMTGLCLRCEIELEPCR